MAKHVFFDCDDCLYKNDWRTANLLTAKIDDYTQTVLGLPPGKAFELYLKYGTALRGLVEEQLIEEKDVDAFLQHVHDINLDDIKPDPALRATILSIPHPRWVFTASIREHAERCLERLGIQDLFLGIISASSSDMIRKVGCASWGVSVNAMYTWEWRMTAGT
jgi:pyrimidine 5'-nucleotidase